MTALTLLTELRRQGVKFIDDGGKLRVVIPRCVVLSDADKDQIRAHKDEILRRLRSGGITVEDVAAVFPGAAVIKGDRDLGTCARCAGNRWWVSRLGMKFCSRCFPPARPDLVVARLGPSAGRKTAA